jgi:hypothetical protein
MPKECAICVEKLNNSSHKPIVCIHCEFEACASCCRRVLLETSEDPYCMQCNKPWTKDFLVENFTKKFVNDDLKKHRETQLYDREKAMLPATQPVVERALEKEKLEDDKAKIAQELKELTKKFNDLKVKKSELDTAIWRIDSVPDAQIMKKERREFVRRCPVDECQGFLSTAWKCGLCKTWTCPECHEPKGLEKDAEHTCKPENVETAKLLAKDTKPCPKCAVPITRISGCNQMFCTACHTAFNWQTLKIDKGNIHNPHYFEMMEALGNNHLQAPMADPCGHQVIPLVTAINAFLKPYGLVANKIGDVDLVRYIAWITHQNEVERARYRTDRVQDNLDLRIKFMYPQGHPKKIDEDRFKQLLQQREKARNKRQEIEQVFASAFELSGAIIRNMLTVNKESRIHKRIRELEKLVVLSRTGFAKIAEKYGGKVPEFEYDFKSKAPLSNHGQYGYYAWRL